MGTRGHERVGLLVVAAHVLPTGVFRSRPGWSTTRRTSTPSRSARRSTDWPTRNVTEAWANAVPDHFFVVKGSRYLALKQLLRSSKDSSGSCAARTARRQARGSPLAAAAGSKIDIERLGAFLGVLPPVATHAVEFRHPSWLTDDVAQLMTEARHDDRQRQRSAVPGRTDVTGNRPYVRFHGLRPGYEYDYTADDLRPWARHLRRYRDGFAFFNNDVGGHAVANALALRSMLCDDAMTGDRRCRRSARATDVVMGTVVDEHQLTVEVEETARYATSRLRRTSTSPGFPEATTDPAAAPRDRCPRLRRGHGWR